METITFNPGKNTLTVCVNDKPRFGCIGKFSETMYRKTLNKRLQLIELNIEEIDKWCEDKRNINNHEAQVEMRKKRNQLMIKTRTIKRELGVKKFANDGIREVSICGLQIIES